MLYDDTSHQDTYADLCTPWKCFQYSENKFPYSAIILRSVFFSGATYRRNWLKNIYKSAAAYRRER